MHTTITESFDAPEHSSMQVQPHNMHKRMLGDILFCYRPIANLRHYLM